VDSLNGIRRIVENAALLAPYHNAGNSSKL